MQARAQVPEDAMAVVGAVQKTAQMTQEPPQELGHLLRLALELLLLPPGRLHLKLPCCRWGRIVRTLALCAPTMASLIVGACAHATQMSVASLLATAGLAAIACGACAGAIGSIRLAHVLPPPRSQLLHLLQALGFLRRRVLRRCVAAQLAPAIEVHAAATCDAMRRGASQLTPETWQGCDLGGNLTRRCCCKQAEEEGASQSHRATHTHTQPRAF